MVWKGKKFWHYRPTWLLHIRLVSYELHFIFKIAVHVDSGHRVSSLGFVTDFSSNVIYF